MQELVFSLDLTSILFIFCLVFPIYYFLIKKHIYFWLDPLLFFVFSNSISISLVIHLYFISEDISEMYFLSFMSCIIAFILGVKSNGSKVSNTWSIEQINKRTIISTRRFSLIINLFLFISVSIVIAANLALLFAKGTLPIFSANPSQAKVTLYTGGWGIVKRINFVLVNFILTISFFKLFSPFERAAKFKKKFYIISVILACLIIISMGSKGGMLTLLNVIFPVFLINKAYNSSFKNKVNSIIHINWIKKYSKYFVIISVLFVGVIISLTGYETTRMDALITRLVSYGDVFYFFYVFDIISDFNHSFVDYFIHISNPLTSMFRLTEYEYSLGTRVASFAIRMPLDKAEAFGPNAQHPIEGLVYFGKFGAPFYSFFIGWLISYVRVRRLRKLGSSPNNIKLFIYVYLCSLIMAATIDFPLFMQKFYDSLIFGSLIMIIIYSMFVFSKFLQR